MLEQFITDGVTQCVINVAQLVKIKDEYRELLLMADTAADGAVQLLLKIVPVWQVRQRIKARLITNSMQRPAQPVLRKDQDQKSDNNKARQCQPDRPVQQIAVMLLHPYAAAREGSQLPLGAGQAYAGGYGILAKQAVRPGEGRCTFVVVGCFISHRAHGKYVFRVLKKLDAVQQVLMINNQRGNTPEATVIMENRHAGNQRLIALH
nr:hypothetical protein [Pseudidiomarina salinarum]